MITITRFSPGQYTITGIDPEGVAAIQLQMIVLKSDIRHLEETLSRLKSLRGVLFKDIEIQSLENEIIVVEEALNEAKLALGKAELMKEEVQAHGHA